jgi:nucleoside-diphosphate kinase
MSIEKTFLMIKPDGVQRGLIGEIVSRFEKKGYQLVAAKLLSVSKELAETHYAEHKGKPFFEELTSFITSSPVFAMVWQGDGVIAGARAMMGSTHPAQSAPGTIRGDYGMHLSLNVIHGSDGPESAEREINIFFSQTELIGYERALNQWI